MVKPTGNNQPTKRMKTKLTIIHNGFHGTTTASVVVNGNPGERVELSPAQVKKLRRAACGSSDCKCGESLLKACEVDEPWLDDASYFLTIPASGTEIRVNGNYPQR